MKLTWSILADSSASTATRKPSTQRKRTTRFSSSFCAGDVTVDSSSSWVSVILTFRSYEKILFKIKKYKIIYLKSLLELHNYNHLNFWCVHQK
jgi:hypothetical protein